MRISIFGLGYVGSVSAVGLAELGHEVIGVDIVSEKVKDLQQGKAPLKEPQLDELLIKNLETGRLVFSTNAQDAIQQSDCALITVGTPSDADGNINLDMVERCIENIAQELNQSSKEEFLIVIRSTIPPETTARMQNLLQSVLTRKCNVIFSMNPEFTREGAAVHDFFQPAIIVFGIDNEAAKAQINRIYEGIDAPTIWVSTKTAELVKYTNNAFHALKVAFANEIGRLATAYRIDGQAVMEILCADKKLNISSKYMKPGFAFGGSCLPKDLRGINSIATKAAIVTPLLRSIAASNDQHIEYFVSDLVKRKLEKVGILGMTFKTKTDDLRESPSLRLIQQLLAQKVNIKMIDANLTPKYLMGRNKQYIDKLLPNWQAYFTDDPKTIFDFSETIVVATNEKIHEHWIELHSNNNHKIIKLYNLNMD
ncbi:MAG: nucleotide sugar dehydrogenase [Bacteroidota bacterium]